MDKQLSYLFDILTQSREELVRRGCSFDLAMAVYEKLWWALSNSIFPKEMQKVCFPYIMKENGLVFESENSEEDVEDCGEVEYHSMLIYSEAFGYCLTYYQNSPYWNVEMHEGRIDGIYAEKLNEEEKKDYVPLTQLKFGDFFEEKALELFRVGAASSPMEYFYTENYEEPVHSCVVFKSYLLPYYIALDQEMLKKDHPELRLLVERAIKVLANSLAGRCQSSILKKGYEASYFILFDGYDFYGPTDGATYIGKALILAGKMIDDAIHELDSYYRFLPEKLRKEEVPVAKMAENV